MLPGDGGRRPGLPDRGLRSKEDSRRRRGRLDPPQAGVDRPAPGRFPEALPWRGRPGELAQGAPGPAQAGRRHDNLAGKCGGRPQVGGHPGRILGSHRQGGCRRGEARPRVLPHRGRSAGRRGPGLVGDRGLPRWPASRCRGQGCGDRDRPPTARGGLARGGSLCPGSGQGPGDSGGALPGQVAPSRDSGERENPLRSVSVISRR